MCNVGIRKLSMSANRVHVSTECHHSLVCGDEVCEYVGFSADESIRWRATSGGVGTSIVKYLFEHNRITHALSFSYNAETLQYVPKFVDSYQKYLQTGSVYQDIDLVGFCAKAFQHLKGRSVLVFALPCQSKAVGELGLRHGIEVMVIGLVCSSQQTMDATFYLLRRLRIRRKDVATIKYRGDGWPGGIQLVLKNNETRFVPNNNSIWKKIFHSRLFAPKRCLRCISTRNDYADVVLADPWWIVSPNDEKKGKTLFFANTESGRNLVKEMLHVGAVLAERTDGKAFWKSAGSTLERKASMRQNTLLRKIYYTLCTSSLYRGIVTLLPFLFEIHCTVLSHVERKILERGKTS